MNRDFSEEKKLSFSEFEFAVDCANIHDYDALIDAVADADLAFFSSAELKLAAEVLAHVSK